MIPERMTRMKKLLAFLLTLCLLFSLCAVCFAEEPTETEEPDPEEEPAETAEGTTFGSVKPKEEDPYGIDWDSYSYEELAAIYAELQQVLLDRRVSIATEQAAFLIRLPAELTLGAGTEYPVEPELKKNGFSITAASDGEAQPEEPAEAPEEEPAEPTEESAEPAEEAAEEISEETPAEEEISEETKEAAEAAEEEEKDPFADVTLIWASSNPEVVSVDEKGVLHPKQTGKACITCCAAENEYAFAYCFVTVFQPVESIKITDKAPLKLHVGDSHQLQAVVLPENAENRELLWFSSDESIVTVDADGTVHAVGEGKATVSCVAADGSETSASIKITVKP